MEIKIFDSELKVMEIIWDKGDLTAGEIAKILKEQVGWNRNTTYTVIKKLIEKNAVERLEPGFNCRALITKEEVRQYEADELIGKLFGGSADVFLSAFLNGKNLSEKEIARLKQIIEKF
ncbi:MAG: BlaI/MecI/CopY family transcriptional regulator [Oscillospiraceae bacterium]|nr:BlaI/MecI/CopY family transcriptional regulator [Oscillospiraceae bacterium]